MCMMDNIILDRSEDVILINYIIISNGNPLIYACQERHAGFPQLHLKEHEQDKSLVSSYSEKANLGLDST